VKRRIVWRGGGGGGACEETIWKGCWNFEYNYWDHSGSDSSSFWLLKWATVAFVFFECTLAPMFVCVLSLDSVEVSNLVDFRSQTWRRRDVANLSSQKENKINLYMAGIHHGHSPRAPSSRVRSRMSNIFFFRKSKYIRSSPDRNPASFMNRFKFSRSCRAPFLGRGSL